ncbi:MAG: alkylation response protein AidB-like acyl-CoA dehydrogenase [Myxococcota bacterium]|jgi:alkylation response protein AidB-like acyl-CoA dehydrogenase
MDLNFSPQDEHFRVEVRDWLEAALSGEFADLRGRGGAGDQGELIAERKVWEQALGAAGWLGLSWPTEYGGRALPLTQEVIFNEEYARANAPGRLGHIGEALLGPTLIAFGTPEHKARFLPKILAGEEYWCQGYSEPGAGSDLANVQCRAVLKDGQWEITGQKIWTSMAEWSEWCFALCRTDSDLPRHKGISYLLVPMNQPGITIRPIEQITGGAEFAEVFFEGAKTAESNVVGGVNGGWKVAMGTLAFERGASTLAQQLSFANELDVIIALAKENGAAQDPLIRQRIADAWAGLRIMRLNALRMLTQMEGGTLGREAMITKLYWATWHRDLGELAMDVLGPDAAILPNDRLHPLQRLFLWTRCDTIYAGSNQIQRNIIGERALGLPRGPR